MGSHRPHPKQINQTEKRPRVVELCVIVRRYGSPGMIGERCAGYAPGGVMYETCRKCELRGRNEDE